MNRERTTSTPEEIALRHLRVLLEPAADAHNQLQADELKTEAARLLSDAAKTILGLLANGLPVRPPDAGTDVPEGSTWRVMYVCRQPEGDEDMGRHDFTSEAEARAYFESDEVTSRMDEYWRAELRVQPPWRTVDAYPYRNQEVKP